MFQKRVNLSSDHDHWFIEWWSAVLLLSVGVYTFIIPACSIIHQSFIDGYLKFLSFDLWRWLFIIIGLFQYMSLQSENIFGRGIAAFLASSLLIWGTLNIAVYGQWHFSLLVWGIFA